MSEEMEARLRDYFEAAHASGALDAKTKELMHLALVLVLGREASAAAHFTAARAMGASDEELAETVHLAAAVAAGSLVSLAGRARRAAENEAKWWRKETQA